MRWPAGWPHPALLFVVLAWGVNFPMVKLAQTDFSPMATAVLRYVAMLPLIFLLTKALGRPLKLPREDWSGILIGGFLGSGLYMVLFLEGMHRTSSGQGAIALATAPIWVAILGAITGHEPVKFRLFAGSVLAFIGVGIAEIGSQGLGDGTLLGTGICLVSAFVWAVSLMFLRPSLNRLDSMTAFAWSLVPASLIMLPLGIPALVQTHWATVGFKSWIGVLYLIFVAGVAGFTAYYRGVAVAGAARASMVAYVIPIVAAFAAWPILGTAPMPAHLIGLAVVLAGVWIVSVKDRPAQEPVASGTMES